MSSSITTTLNLAHLPTEALYGNDTNGPGWLLSPKPYELSPQHAAVVQRLGPILKRFLVAVDELYRLSAKSRDEGSDAKTGVPAWIANLYDQGKPESLVQFARMKRFKNQTPLILRPDLLLHNDGSWTLCEIDAVPGGLGFTAAMNRFYRLNGMPVIEGQVPPHPSPVPSDILIRKLSRATAGESPARGEGSQVGEANLKTTLPGLFLEMLQAIALPSAGKKPVIAIVLSDESADYRSEMAWLVNAIQTGSEGHGAYPNITLLHPRDLDLVKDRLVYHDSETGDDKPIDVLYRFFELFDLPNIPKIELIHYAIKRGNLVCTAPFKPQLEEKLSLALLHHPVLVDYWQKALGEDDFLWLKAGVPEGWVVDPTPLPAQAVIPNLSPAGKAVQSFESLKTLSQKERELVLKPSGFSPLGWGSRGVTIGHDHPAEVWTERLDEAIAAFPKTPYILQKFRSADVQMAYQLDPTSGDVKELKARVRLCPYYFDIKGKMILAGALATACPANKKLIHGMKDAVMMPVSLTSTGV